MHGIGIRGGAHVAAVYGEGVLEIPAMQRHRGRSPRDVWPDNSVLSRCGGEPEQLPRGALIVIRPAYERFPVTGHVLAQTIGNGRMRQTVAGITPDYHHLRIRPEGRNVATPNSRSQNRGLQLHDLVFEAYRTAGALLREYAADQDVVRTGLYAQRRCGDLAKGLTRAAKLVESLASRVGYKNPRAPVN